MSASSTRQRMFEGAEPPPEHLAIDADRLRPYLAARLPGVDGALEVLKFKGGQSNPTYRVRGPGAAYVLRRQPPGRLVESAHAIDREYRVLQALAAAGIPVPRPHLWCDDEAVLGFPFYVVEHVEGRVFWDADLPGLEPPERAAVYDEMNDVIARLHMLDLDVVGLGDLGRRDGYAARNLARWSRIYEASKLVDIADMDWLIAKLPQVLPQDGEARLIHGDYGLYNIIVHEAEPRLLAVLDWEMATVGDPLVDLAHHLRAWWEVPDPQGSAATSLAGLDLSALGIPTMGDYAAAYFRRRGLAPVRMNAYLAYAQFRYAAMVQGILKRAQEGTASGRVVLHRQERVVEAAWLARRTLESGSA